MVDIYLSKKDMRDTKCFLIHFSFTFVKDFCGFGVCPVFLSLSLIGTFLRAYYFGFEGKMGFSF